MAQIILTTLEVFGIGGICNFIIQVFAALIIVGTMMIRKERGKSIKHVENVFDDSADLIYEKSVKHDWYPAWIILKMFLLFPVEIIGSIVLIVQCFKIYKEEDAAE